MDRTSLRQGSAERFARLWERETSAPDVFQFLAQCPELKPDEKAEICVIDQLHRWPAKLGIPVERYFENVPDLGADDRLKLRLVVVEFRSRQALGESPELDSFLRRFPDLCDPLRNVLASPLANGSPPAGVAPTTSLPSTDVPGPGFPTQNDSRNQNVLAPFGVEPVPPPSLPAKIGRYRVLRILGDGGFGRVYLSYDDVLRRQVAIKVPHAYRISCPEDVEAYLNEARLVAGLDAHAIAVVPVYDCGQTEDGLCYVVSKYIEGSDLATKIKRTPLTFSAAAELVAKVAEALHAAHLHRVVHRDVKPANILIDVNDRPFLADFGIALKEEDYGTGDRTMGTIPYMSPEQLRGEGHLVDGRSDIFSLGVVLYELICGRRPFPSNRFAQVASVEPRPPRQINDAIPKELERICLEALSQRVSDRYSTALDMAADLNDFLKVGSGARGPVAVVAPLSGSGVVATSGQLAAAREIPIVPKGLRSFDWDDAGFFLELLPGPRDREGLPESVHFWKTRMQETDPDKTFRVGLLYGPSGSGKSSLLKAGVIPRLGDDVISIYIESTPLDTEIRLLKALRKECPDLPHDLGLPETATALRRGRGTRKKVVVILDQFEQWLHARPAMEKSDLVRALRQSDGQHLQCVVSVRDDFWMAVTHLMDELEVALVPGENVAAIDLFNLRHAKKVLTAIGHAYNALPAVGDDISTEQKQFINQTIADLARDDRVIPVHLALFAQMVKDRPWVLATLKELGGTEGVGVTFLEETFNGPTGTPSHRLHQRAARLVLGALLSEQGGNIKGAMRSHQELLAVSGYQQQPREFESLLRILDSELRLITPTDPDGSTTDPASAGGSASRGSEPYFHLTHDYLVPSLREWLTRKQKETRRGRAELLLAERAAVWSAHPASRSLPSFFEWSSILWFAPPNSRKSPKQHREVLTAAARYFGIRILIAAVLIGLLAWGTFEWSGANPAATYVNALATARIGDVPVLIQKLEPYRRWADPRLRKLFDESGADSPERLRAALALLPVDNRFAGDLSSRLTQSEPGEFAVVCDALQGVSDRTPVIDRLWKDATDGIQASSARFRAGAALASFSEGGPMPEFVDWKRVAPFLTSQLVATAEVDPASYDMWLRHLRPIHRDLIPELAKIFRDTSRSNFQRNLSASVLCAFVDDGDPLLAELGVDATPTQVSRVLPKLCLNKPPISERLHEIVLAPPESTADEDQLDRWAKRRANAAALLLELEEPEPAWKLLHSEPDPRTTTYLVARLSDCRAEPALLLSRLQKEGDPGVRANLVLALGSYPIDSISGNVKSKIQQQLVQLCQEDPTCAVHSASEWALRSWKLTDKVAALRTEAAKAGRRDGFGWYVTAEGHTLAVIKGPVDAKLGSPPNELGRDSDESLTTRHIDQTFAFSTTEVTTSQYKRFRPNFRHSNEHAPSGECPINAVSWFDAACYCRWLSEQEHLPEDQMCFPTRDKIKAGMVLPDNVLLRTGYRLPTDAEWEYACRGGSSTIRFYGHDPALLGKYAWYYGNADDRSWPVGSVKPNAFGLFDMLGNVSEWCFDIYARSLAAETDAALNGRTIYGVSVVERGGGYSSNARTTRSANRKPSIPQASSFSLGFRIARTLYPNSRSR